MTVFISQRYANFAALTRFDLNGTFGTYIAFNGAAALCRLIETVKPGCVFVQGPEDEAVVRLAEQWTSKKVPRWAPPAPPDPPNGGVPSDPVAKGIVEEKPAAPKAEKKQRRAA